MKKIVPSASGESIHVGVVVSRFNASITDAMLVAALAAMKEAGVSPDNTTIASVPGALEIPLALQTMGQVGTFDALIALGAVIRGDTYHFEIVAEQSAAGLVMVQLDLGIPIGNGILTTDTEEQAKLRTRDKARDATLAALEMANLLADMRELSK